jgi:hypothetical protein
MRTYEMEKSLIQIKKIRASLGDHNSRPYDIKKPAPMDHNRFNRRIERLIKHETVVTNCLHDSLLDWQDRVYGV